MALTPGTPAPDFTVNDQNGQPVALRDFRGRRVALYFYPKDDTEGCTKQACNLRDNIGDLREKGIVVLGVSIDNEKSHRKFEKKYELTFPLLADTEHQLVDAYEVWGEKKFMGRTYMGTFRVTFLINEEGVIEQVIDKVETQDHAAQILAAWGMD